MANYFARVELHGARWPEDYEELHTEMAKHNFGTCITLGDKNSSLPTAFYFATGRVSDVETVFKAVKKCADTTGYKNEVSVVKSAGSWHSLSKKCN